MDPFAVSHFSDKALLHDLKSLVARDRRTTAILLTRIAEVDERKVYRGEGYSSMHAYCLHELHLSEDATYRCINAARAARRFPGVLVALVDGRLHLRAVLMLAPHLTSGNADELVAAATHRTRAEIELLLAARFPRPDLPERLLALSSPPPPAPLAAPQVPAPACQPAPEQVEATNAARDAHGHTQAFPSPARQLAPEQVEGTDPATGHAEVLTRPAPQLAPEQVEAPAPRPRMTPLAPERFGLQVTIDRETHDLLQQARALMSHQVPPGEIAPVLKSALKLLVAQLEKRKFGATDRPGPSRPCESARHIPAAVKRAVRERDGDQCAFVSDSGHRCEARTMLEFDHAEPVARGGEARVDCVRLLCRAHNQYAAERAFGAEFMERKRAEAQCAGHGGKRTGPRGTRNR